MRAQSNRLALMRPSLRGGPAAIALTTAAIAAGASVYSADQQKDAQKESTAVSARNAKLAQTQDGTQQVNPAMYQGRKRVAPGGFDAQAMLQPSAAAGLLGS